MRRVLICAVVVVLAALAYTALAQHLIFDSATIVWKDAPVSLPKGAKVAVPRGDPTQPGIFTMRLKFPASYIVSPHWHTQDDGTVISGALLLAVLDDTCGNLLQGPPIEHAGDFLSRRLLPNVI